MPKIHHREKLVTEAENKIRTTVAETTRELTIWEALQVVTNVLSGDILGTCKYRIREERHGHTNTPGGWEANMTFFTSCDLKDLVMSEDDWLNLHDGHEIEEEVQEFPLVDRAVKRMHYRHCRTCGHTHLFKMETVELDDD